MDSKTKTVNVKTIIRNPIGIDNLLFRRITSRYKRKGTVSNNKGFLQVSRDAVTGRFVTRA